MKGYLRLLVGHGPIFSVHGGWQREYSAFVLSFIFQLDFPLSKCCAVHISRCLILTSFNMLSRTGGLVFYNMIEGVHYNIFLCLWFYSRFYSHLTSIWTHLVLVVMLFDFQMSDLHMVLWESRFWYILFDRESMVFLRCNLVRRCSCAYHYTLQIRVSYCSLVLNHPSVEASSGLVICTRFHQLVFRFNWILCQASTCDRIYKTNFGSVEGGA